MYANLREWFRSHSAAILLTIVSLQNSHIFSSKVEALLSVVGSILTGIGGQ